MRLSRQLFIRPQLAKRLQRRNTHTDTLPSSSPVLEHLPDPNANGMQRPNSQNSRLEFILVLELRDDGEDALLGSRWLQVGHNVQISGNT